MAELENTEQPYPRPLSGAKVEHLPSALIPARAALIGPYVTLESLDAARHAVDLFEASHGSEAALRTWDYLPWGPWNSEEEYTNVLRQQTARHDQIYYAICPVADGKACGQASFLDIQPEQGVIEIGSSEASDTSLLSRFVYAAASDQTRSDIDADKQAMVAKRLEDRAQMPKFAAIRENFFDKIGLPITGRIHELGCGTGAVCRAIASRPGFVGSVVGSDLSASLIETAKHLTAKSVLKNIEYYQADAQGSDAHKGQYDLVLANTVISHVADPAALLRETIRLARPGGQIILHDGDYASMTFGTNMPELDHKMPGLILQAVVANFHVMREVPRLLHDLDVKITHTIGDVVLEVGTGEYFPSLAKNYGPIAVSAGFAVQSEFDQWIAAIDRALSENTFFGSCNYVTYGMTKVN